MVARAQGCLAHLTVTSLTFIFIFRCCRQVRGKTTSPVSTRPIFSPGPTMSHALSPIACDSAFSRSEAPVHVALVSKPSRTASKTCGRLPSQAFLFDSMASFSPSVIAEDWWLCCGRCLASVSGDFWPVGGAYLRQLDRWPAGGAPVRGIPCWPAGGIRYASGDAHIHGIAGRPAVV